MLSVSAHLIVVWLSWYGYGAPYRYQEHKYQDFSYQYQVPEFEGPSNYFIFRLSSSSPLVHYQDIRVGIGTRTIVYNGR
jgi:hypothetical protein